MLEAIIGDNALLAFAIYMNLPISAGATLFILFWVIGIKKIFKRPKMSKKQMFWRSLMTFIIILISIQSMAKGMLELGNPIL